jgi:tetratricopeptide (TPR) repeat protein
MSGPPVARRELETTSLLDVAPTVLYLAGLPVPDDMDGRVLLEAVRPEFRQRFPQTRIATYEITPHRSDDGSRAGAPATSNDEFLANLRSLGYIGGGGATAAPDSASAGATSGVSSHVNLGAALIASGELVRAEQEILSALRLDPDYPPAQKLLFNLRYRQKRFHEAVAVAHGLLEGADAGDSRFVTRVARAHRQAGRLEQGIREYRSRFEGGQRRLGALLCRLLFEAGDTEAAQAVARAVLADEPLNVAAMDTVFNIAMRQGRPGDVESLLEAALDVNGRSVAHLNYLAFVRESGGDLAGAERLLLDALEVDPEHGASLVNLGRLYDKHGRRDEAVPLLRRALAANPGNADARRILDRIESEIND